MSTRARDFHAHNWPSRLWFVVVPVLAVVAMAWGLGPSPGPWDSSAEANQYWMLLLAAWLLGLSAGGLLSRLALGPLERRQAQRNGWPFAAGETVRVLAGSLRGKLLVLDETWNERGLVRVAAPSDARRHARLVYTWVQVERAVPATDRPADHETVSVHGKRVQDRESLPGFAVIYRWRLKPGCEDDFVAAWSETTRRLRAERGALGSRLHRGSDGLWYAYAQWPATAVREASRLAGPVDAQCARRMDAAISERLPEIVLEPVADFLGGSR